MIFLITNPRAKKPINKYITGKLNEIPNYSFEFDTGNVTLRLRYNLDMRYAVNNVSIKTSKGSFTANDFTITLSAVKLLFHRFDIKNVRIHGGNLVMNTAIQTDKKTFGTSILKLIPKLPVSVDNLNMKDIEIILNQTTKIRVNDLLLSTSTNEHKLWLQEYMSFRVNNDKLNSKLRIRCANQLEQRRCNIDISNLNSKYLYNGTDGYFDAVFNVVINDSWQIIDGDFFVKSSVGSFHLPQYFDMAINFNELSLSGDFNADNFNITSLTTNFDKTTFFMSMFIKNNEKYKEITMNFNAKNLPVKKLQQLWPNFLGNKIRPWILKHITGGDIPQATAQISTKYYNDDTLIPQNTYAEVQMNKISLDYDPYFPKITNINGMAKFTQNGVDINIDRAKVLSSTITNGYIGINFAEKNKNLIIDANIDGKFYDLFVHINKGNAADIKRSMSNVIDDISTKSAIKMVIPMDNTSFRRSIVQIDSVLLNKTNRVLANSDVIKISFVKPQNKNTFHGSVVLTKSKINFLPLNINKQPNNSLIIDYECDLNDDLLIIKQIAPQKSGFMSFAGTGYYNPQDKIFRLDIKNILYNKSNYNLSFKSDTVLSEINITGDNINYGNISNTNLNNGTIGNQGELLLNMTLKRLSFNNGKLLNPKLSLFIQDGTLRNIDFVSWFNRDRTVTINSNKNAVIKIYSNDYGELLRLLNITPHVKYGGGKITLSKYKKTHLWSATFDINKRFLADIALDANKNITEEKEFKKLKKSIKESVLRFDNMTGSLLYDNTSGIFELKNIAAGSRFVELDVLASGFINTKTGELHLKGLLVPFKFINGLFGISKIPFISSLIFGQKNSGLFASKFEIRRKDTNSKYDVKINKFSMILPGFLRNM